MDDRTLPDPSHPVRPLPVSRLDIAHLVFGGLIVVALPLEAGADALPVAVQSLASLPRPSLRRNARLIKAHPPGNPSASTQLRVGHRVGWGPGEQLKFDVRVGLVDAARATLGVRRGRSRLRPVLEGAVRAVPLFGGFVPMSQHGATVVGLPGLYPHSSVVERHVGHHHRRVETRHGRVTHQHIRRQQAGKRSQHHRPRHLGLRALDPLSALFYLRSVELPLRAPIELTVLAGTALYELSLRSAGRERIQTALGPRWSFRLDATARRISDAGASLAGKPLRRARLWLSSDSQRIPLRIEGDTKLGRIAASIRHYRAPRHRLTVSPRPPPVRSRAPTGR